MSRKISAGKTDMDKINKKMSELGSGLYFKPREGKNVIRVLPPWNDKGLFYFETTLHYGLQHEGKQRAYPCLGADECPICEAIEKMEEEGGAEDVKLAKRLKSRTKYYTNIIDLKTGKVLIWGFSRKILSTLLSYMSDPDWGDITDPDEGFDVVVERTGTKLDTKYEIRVKPRSSEISIDDWEEQMKNLPEEVVDDIDADALEDIVDENFGSSKKKKHRDDDEDEEPRKKRRDDSDDDDDDERPKKKKKDDDDDDDDFDEKDDDDDDEKPKKKRPRDEDEDEDDRPRKKKKSRNGDEDEERKKRRKRNRDKRKEKKRRGRK